MSPKLLYPILNYFNNFPLIPLTYTFRGQYRILIWMEWRCNQVQGCKGCMNCLIPGPAMVGGKKALISRHSKMHNFRAYFVWKDMEWWKLFSLKFKFLHIFENFWIWAPTSWCPISLSAMEIWLNYPLFSYIPHPFPQQSYH